MKVSAETTGFGGISNECRAVENELYLVYSVIIIDTFLTDLVSR